MEPGALVVAEVLEGLDLVQARLRIARVAQVLQVPPRRLLLAGGQRVDEGVEIPAGRVTHRGILASQLRTAIPAPHPEGRMVARVDRRGPELADRQHPARPT